MNNRIGWVSRGGAHEQVEVLGSCSYWKKIYHGSEMTLRKAKKYLIRAQGGEIMTTEEECIYISEDQFPEPSSAGMI